jgi:hypothetical protein
MEYYTYAYLREDRTPYYIGKGKGNRAYRRRNKGIKPPKDKSRILILKKNLTEEESFRHEIYMIAVFGRNDLGTGILHNKTDGGDGTSGWIPSEETKKKISEKATGRIMSENDRLQMSKSQIGRKHPEEVKKKISQKQLGKNNHNYQYDWKFTFGGGKSITTSSMPSWCKSNGYDKAALMRVCKGQVGRHKDIVSVEKLAQAPSTEALDAL